MPHNIPEFQKTPQNFLQRFGTFYTNKNAADRLRTMQKVKKYLRTFWNFSRLLKSYVYASERLKTIP